MSTYDDLESRIEYQQTLWFRIRQIFFNPEEVDSEEIHRRRQQVVGELETVVSDAEELLADAEETTAKLRQTGRSTTEVPGEPVEQIEHVQKVATDLLTAESQYLRSNEQDELESLVSQLETFHERVVASAAFGHAVADAESLHDEVIRVTAEPRRTGGPLQLEEPTSEKLTEAAERVQAVVQKHLTTLPSDVTSTLQRVRNNLETAAAYLDAKRAFDEKVPRVDEEVNALLNAAEPYLQYEEYLTEPTRKRLREQIRTTRRQQSSARRQLSLDALAVGDRRRLQRGEAAVDRIVDRLDEYNASFVDRERNRHATFFEASDGTTLNPEQQRAVVRNGCYNQVVAGAGTGKTLTLVYRIAYLVRRGINPSNILAVTFGKEAADEIQTRLETEFGIHDVGVQTLHSYGLGIVRQSTERSLSVAKTTDLRNEVERAIDDPESVDETFGEHYRAFLSHTRHDTVSAADFEEKAEYVAERKERSYTTVRGEQVASRAEALIADFLFEHDVDYRYEQIAQWADSADNKGPYRPDFYLPEHDIYIEHWGIDKNGEVAEWFEWSTADYRAKLWWGRSQFATNEPSLIDTYEFEHETGRLRRALKHRLTVAGVELEQMEFETFVKEAYGRGNGRDDVVESFQRFVENAKLSGVSPDEIPSRLAKSDREQFHFGHAARVIYKEYEQLLTDEDLVDYQDMLTIAAETIRGHREVYADQFDHVVVDEFQDTSGVGFELIDLLTGPNVDSHLFCVGDDWQSIYSFRGAEVKQFVNLADRIGPPEPIVTRLTTNYRCPPTVVEASNRLIRENPTQIDKTVEPASDDDTTPIAHVVDGYDNTAYRRRIAKYTVNLVEQFLSEGGSPDDIAVLCRYDDGAPFLSATRRELRRNAIPHDDYHPGNTDSSTDGESEGVSVLSVHSAKGREAELVILVNAVSGILGFPSEQRRDTLIDPVRDTTIERIPDERRLFYVALTRTADQLHVLTRPERWSQFLETLDEQFEWSESALATGAIGDRVTITAYIKRLFDPSEKQHQAGVVEDDADEAKFVSWESDDPPSVMLDTWYRLVGVRVDEYNGDRQLVFDGQCLAVELFTDYTEASNSAELLSPQPDTGENRSAPPTTGGVPDLDVSYSDLDVREDPLGRGRDTVVYPATHHTGDHSRQFVVKEPATDEQLDIDTVSRFLDNVKEWSRLDNHDHVADVVAYGNDPYPRIVVEPLMAGSLADRVGEVSFDRAISIVTSVARAIEYAHNRGVCHGAIKPSNVRFLGTLNHHWDVPKVTDWGVATRPDRPCAVTPSPQYAAPEQLELGRETTESQTDIFQLGLLTYELTTGEYPLTDSSSVFDRKVVPPREFDEILPQKLIDTLTQALAPEPEDRHDTVRSLRRELGSLAE